MIVKLRRLACFEEIIWYKRKRSVNKNVYIHLLAVGLFNPIKSDFHVADFHQPSPHLCGSSTTKIIIPIALSMVFR